MTGLPLFDGETFEPAKDQDRIGAQFTAVRDHLIGASRWFTLAELEAELGHPQASISARLRDLRKPKFGGYKVERRRRGGDAGTFEYRCTGERERGGPPAGADDAAPRGETPVFDFGNVSRTTEPIDAVLHYLQSLGLRGGTSSDVCEALGISRQSAVDKLQALFERGAITYTGRTRIDALRANRAVFFARKR